MFNKDQINEMQARISNLENVLDIEKETKELNKKHLMSQDSTFWNEPKKAEKLMREIKFLEKKIKSYKECKTSVDDLEVMYNFFLNK